MRFKVSRMKGNKNGVFFSVKCARGQGDTIFRRPSSLGKPSRNTSQPSPRFKRCMIHSPWYRTVFRLSTPLLSLNVKKYFQRYRVSQRIFILIVIDNLYDHFYRFANDKIASFGYRFSFFFFHKFYINFTRHLVRTKFKLKFFPVISNNFLAKLIANNDNDPKRKKEKKG